MHGTVFFHRHSGACTPQQPRPRRPDLRHAHTASSGCATGRAGPERRTWLSAILLSSCKTSLHNKVNAAYGRRRQPDSLTPGVISFMPITNQPPEPFLEAGLLGHQGE